MTEPPAPDDPFRPPSAAPPPQPWGPPPGQQPWGAPPVQQPWGPPYAQPPQWGWQPAPPTNGWAVTSLITGILPLPPVAIGTGITALVQMRHRPYSGRGMAITGIVLGAVWSLVLAAIIIAVVMFVGSDSLGPVAEAPSTSVGACVQHEGSHWVLSECSTRHDGEIYLVEELDDPALKGVDTLDWQADSACYDAFEDYVGTSYEDSDHEYDYFRPTEAEWEAGEHRVVCLITPGFADHLVGSVHNTES